MAASIMAAQCSMCCNPCRDLYLVQGRKAGEMKPLIDCYFPTVKDKIDRICRSCFAKIEVFHEFKRSVESKMERKRTPSTPATNTPKRKKTVAENILSSVEKIRPQIAQLSDSVEKLDIGQPAKTGVPVLKRTTSVTSNTDAKTVVINETLSAISTLATAKTSILSSTAVHTLCGDNIFTLACQELSTNVPFLFDLLDTLLGSTGNRQATMALIYAIILNSRNRRVSAIQKQLSIMAIQCHADNKLLSRLNKLHITVSAETKSNIMSDCAEFCEQKVVKAISEGLNGKLNGDNVDIYVHTNDIRMSNKSKDYHFFATDWTPFRLNEGDFSVNEWLLDYLSPQSVAKRGKIDISTFMPDTVKFRENIQILVARVLIKHCPALQWMELVVPKHIDHPLEEEMTRQTTSYPLPILLKNEAKYEDCLHILDSYEKQMQDMYQKAGREDEFNNTYIPVGGDQLTRVRFDGTKDLRMGAHTAYERLENLYPVITEMFHTQMDLLEKTIKKFMVQSTGRDSGTLTNLQIRIQRTSVNGNVKSRFKAHDEFVQLAGKAYILEAALDFLGMDSLTGEPTQNQLPENIQRLHIPRRKAIYDDFMKGFLPKVVGPLSFEEVQTPDMVDLLVAGTLVKLPVTNDKVDLHLEYQGRLVNAIIPVKALQNHSTVMIPVGPHQIKAELKSDDLNSYIRNFLLYYFVLDNFKDATKQGDIVRTNNMLKMMIPLFYRHSNMSKYMIECVDYILKTEIILPPKLAVQVQTASFVNPKGRQGKNKPADLNKENQVKELKELIRGLGANKTEKSIVRLSKAYPVIKDIVENLDSQLSYKTVKTTHKGRSEEEDLKVILTLLRDQKPFQNVPNRNLIGYSKMKLSVFHELLPLKQTLYDKILYTANRLSRGQYVEMEEVPENRED